MLWITGDQAFLHRITHDRRGALLDPSSGFQVGNGNFANQRKYVQLQRAKGFGGESLSPADIAYHPLTMDFFKNIAAFLCLFLLLLPP